MPFFSSSVYRMITNLASRSTELSSVSMEGGSSLVTSTSGTEQS